MRAHILAISAEKQRYLTVGDWWFGPDDTIEVRVTEQSDWRYEFLVALHEFVEAALCKQVGVSEETVTAFDTAFESAREEDDTSEPGDAPDCPYLFQHRFATRVEHMVARALDVDWDEYDMALR